jgi:hypothetical protein
MSRADMTARISGYIMRLKLNCSRICWKRDTHDHHNLYSFGERQMLCGGLHRLMQSRAEKPCM